MKHLAVVLVVLVGGLVGASVAADDITLESVPPVVVKTVPEAGTAAVDPKLTEIKVTFSKDMQLPVKLEPGKTYAIWVNSDKFTNFKDTDGRSAVPYLLVFKTKK
jgi:hypothetical protein